MALRTRAGGGPPMWLVVVVAVASVVVLVGGVWLYRDQADALRQRAHVELETIAGLKVDQITSWREQHLRTAARLTNSRLYAGIVNEWIENPESGSTEGILQRMRAEQPSNDYFDVILVDVDGRELLRLGDRIIPLHDEVIVSAREAIESGGPLLTDLHTGPEGLPAHIDVIAPLYFERDGELVSPGAIVLQSSAADFLYPLVQSWPTPSVTAETALVVRDGEDVVFLNDLRHAESAALRLRLPLTLTDNPSVMAALGVEGVVEGIGYRGERVLAYIAPVPGADWLMIAKIDESEALADWRDRSVLIVALVLGLIALIAGGFGIVWQIGRASFLSAQLEAERLQREGQEMMLSLFRAAPMGLGITVDRMFTVVSDRFCEMLGYSRGDLLGKSERMIYASDRQFFQVGRQLQRKLAETGTGTVETRLRRKDDTTVDVILHSAAIDPDDSSRGAAFAVLDITERKQQEREVRAHNDLLEALVRISEASFESVEKYLSLALGEALHLSDSLYARFYHYTSEDDRFGLAGVRGVGEAAGKDPHAGIVPPEHSDLLAQVLRKRSPVMRGGTGMRRITGSQPTDERDDRLLAVPVVSDDRVVGVAIVSGGLAGYSESDARRLSVLMSGAWKVVRRHEAESEVRRINASLEQIVNERTGELRSTNKELKAATEELEGINRELFDANEAKTRFLSSISHELRTPLNSIIGFSGIMLDGLVGEVSAEQRHQLAMVNRSGRHLLDIINDILDLSRIEAGKVDVHMESFDAGALAGEVLEVVAPVAAERGLCTSLELPEEGECTVVFSDPVKVRQILLNLLSNAVKFTESGSVRLVITCTAPDRVGLSVVDTGPGIPAADHEEIFEEFGSRERHTRNQHEGTGLGLAISRGLASVLGGQIELQSEVGEGSTFTLTLPCSAD